MGATTPEPLSQAIKPAIYVCKFFRVLGKKYKYAGGKKNP